VIPPVAESGNPHHHHGSFVIDTYLIDPNAPGTQPKPWASDQTPIPQAYWQQPIDPLAPPVAGPYWY
jgi:hypothetical protein